MKHTVSTLNVFGWTDTQFGFLDCDADYTTIAIHPEWNIIFLVEEERTIIAYNMDNRKVYVIPALAIWYVRCSVLPEDFISRPYYLPYVPLFLEKLAEE